MKNLESIIKQVRSEAANHKSGFISCATGLNIGLLARQYKELQSEAPRRHLVDRKYLFKPTRNGTTSADKNCRRLEERLAMALYNERHAPRIVGLPDGQRIEIFDYQVPLKAVHSDSGLGKPDLMGLIDDKRLAVLELKVKGGNAPLGAILEALVYAAILEENIEDIRRELTDNGYVRPKSQTPTIVVLGPVDYWQEFDEYDENWLDKIAPILSDITQSLSTEIQFIELKVETHHLKRWLSSTKPRLPGEVSFKLLFCSKMR